ncbi:futalosine hydrolase [Desulfospira joergensenii]|uniref:futalosine hydrolase n=1 Tax=Desulfospira joergensenii TaxID=53329 RepID=UPI0003B3EF9C|nr:futalosine hydrolase [Desulfospira joergensenii]
MADQTKVNSRVLILCATEPEMAPFLDRHAPRYMGRVRSGGKLFSGSLGKMDYHLLISGPGVFNTVHALSIFLEESVPDFILDTGIAGIFPESGLLVGDIGLAAREQYIHTGIQNGNTIPAPLPFDLIPDLESSRQGIYPVDPALIEKVYEGLKSGLNNVRVFKGRFITVSALTGTKSEAEKIHAGFFPLMEAMEGAGAAHTAALYRVPFLEVRAGSNIVGERDKSKWNIPLAADRVCRICEQVTALS